MSKSPWHSHSLTMKNNWGHFKPQQQQQCEQNRFVENFKNRIVVNERERDHQYVFITTKPSIWKPSVTLTWSSRALPSLSVKASTELGYSTAPRMLSCPASSVWFIHRLCLKALRWKTPNPHWALRLKMLRIRVMKVNENASTMQIIGQHFTCSYKSSIHTIKGLK